MVLIPGKQEKREVKLEGERRQDLAEVPLQALNPRFGNSSGTTIKEIEAGNKKHKIRRS